MGAKNAGDKLSKLATLGAYVMGNIRKKGKGIEQKAKPEKVKKTASPPVGAVRTASAVQKAPKAAPVNKNAGPAGLKAKPKTLAAATAKGAGKKTDKGEKGEKREKGGKEHLSTLEPRFTSSGEAICREVGCEHLATTAGYCRLCYIKNWRKIKRKELILREGKLNQYIEELVAKYPDKYIEAIRNDLASDKEFNKVIHELELEDSLDDFDADSDGVESLIDSIRRDIDDEGDAY